MNNNIITRLLSITFQDVFNVYWENFYLWMLLGSFIAGIVHWRTLFIG